MSMPVFPDAPLFRRFSGTISPNILPSGDPSPGSDSRPKSASEAANATQHGKVPASIAVAQHLVGPALREAVDRLPADVREVAAYHFGWIDERGLPTGMEGGGKALRATLALLSAQAAGAPAERGVPASVAVELIHNFSLLHDDVMDQGTHRRHRPTAWTIFGSSAAILAGDALLMLASETLLDNANDPRAAHNLAAATQRLIAGQASDVDFEHRDDVTLDECQAMIDGKTGALLSCACSIGAEYVGAPDQLVHGLADFGTHVGLAFQAVDDLLGIWGSSAVTGKPVLADIHTRKKSLPVVAALTGESSSAAQLRQLYRREEEFSTAELPFVAQLIEEAGGRKWTLDCVESELSRARDCIESLRLQGEISGEFMQIAHFVTDREY